MARAHGGRPAAWMSTGAAALLLLAACTGVTDQPDDDQTSTGTVTVWDWNAGSDFYTGAFSDYSDSQDRIEVRYQFQQGDTFATAIQAAFRAGSAPDLFMGYFDTIPGLIDKGWVRPIGDPADPAVAAWMETFPEGSFRENVHIFDGMVYSFPFNPQSTIYLYYNQSVLDAAGIAAPPTTWGELRAQAAQVVERTDAYGMVTGGKDVWPWFLNVSYLAATAGACNAAIGGSMPMAFDYRTGRYDPDNPATRAAIELWLDMKADGSVLPGIDSLSDADAHAALGNGRAAFMFSGSWTPSVLGEVAPEADFGLAPVPVPDAGRAGYDLVNIGSSWVVSADTPNPEAVFEVIQHMTSLPFQQGYVSSGAGLSVFPEANTADLLGARGLLEVYQIGQQTTRPAPVLPPEAGTVTPLLSDPNYTAVLQQIWLGEVEVGAGLADLEQRMNAELDEALADGGLSAAVLQGDPAGNCGGS